MHVMDMTPDGTALLMILVEWGVGALVVFVAIWLAVRRSRSHRPTSTASGTVFAGGVALWSKNTRELPDDPARGRGDRMAQSGGDDQYPTDTR